MLHLKIKNQTMKLKMYRIHWQNKLTGVSGKGTKPTTLEIATATVNEMNIKYTHCIHWIECDI